jgi:hypothetical protein
MQMFLAGYLQRLADSRGLGMRFVAIAPRQFLAGTRIGEAAAAAYGAEVGESPENYMKRFPAPLDAEGTARALISVASGDERPAATLLVLSGDGLEAI